MGTKLGYFVLYLVQFDHFFVETIYSFRFLPLQWSSIALKWQNSIILNVSKNICNTNMYIYIYMYIKYFGIVLQHTWFKYDLLGKEVSAQN